MQKCRLKLVRNQALIFMNAMLVKNQALIFMNAMLELLSEAFCKGLLSCICFIYEIEFACTRNPEHLSIVSGKEKRMRKLCQRKMSNKIDVQMQASTSCLLASTKLL
ncbi:hypothetical protein O6H91_22G006700 [Diphasiastrum complanatum]|uniref:Uncharacterized protein n=2 Tax=Diphasiastrum complanatum TaxID=34168 RepID=A0ACC2ACI8_DIPCM|nr:hypothetical protein O6H91_22G006600 [Diphasiastrum complanatum]KAJ7515231.1 hypothetical protein O6H91_22G006700 [Diphasiastrum complanatum]